MGEKKQDKQNENTYLIRLGKAVMQEVNSFKYQGASLCKYRSMEDEVEVRLMNGEE